MTSSAAGKGDDCRIGDFKSYRDNYDKIFNKKEDTCGLSDEEFNEYIEQRRKEIPSKPQLKEDMFAEEAEEV